MKQADRKSPVDMLSTGQVVTLTSAQIQAASRLHQRLKLWNATDAGLEMLSSAITGFELAACLMKAAAVNQLYGTNVYAIGKMAEHIAGVMARRPPDDQLVDELASPKPFAVGGKKRRFLSFASKFAHFFVDPDKFQIFDSYAVRMIALHLGSRRAHTYAQYGRDFSALRSQMKLECTNRELDRYLWLAGLYRESRTNAKAKINVEVRALLESAVSDGNVKADLAEMLGNVG